MNDVMKLTGALLSPDDSRDYTISPAASAVTFPREFQLDGLPGIKDQLAGSCVAHACAYLCEHYKSLPFGVGFVYGYRPDWCFQGVGMYPREAMKILLDYGNVPYKNWKVDKEIPYITSLVEKYKDVLLKLAAPNKVASYARLYTEQEVMAAVYAGNPVLAVINTGGAQLFGNGVYRSPEDNYAGLHAITVWGWKTDKNNRILWKVANSWGSDWGENGFCWMIPSEVTRRNDMWMIQFPDTEPNLPNDDTEDENENGTAVIRRTLRSGSKGDDVVDLQEKLNALGYNCGSADGIFGSKTKSAVKAYQKAKGLVEDGIVGRNTWASLDSNDEENNLSLALKKWGFKRPSSIAVKQFQCAMGLKPDGIAGPETWSALNGEIIKPRITEEDMACQCGKYCDGYPNMDTTAVRIWIERIWRILESEYPGVQIYVANRVHPTPNNAIAGGQRCSTWNSKRGGAKASQHIYGTAADIYAKLDGVKDSVLRQRLEDLALEMNPYGGVGYGARYIVHVDMRGKRARWKY